MKLLSIRFVLIIALALIITVAVLSAGATALVLTHGTSAAQQRSTLIQMMLVNSKHWADPAWQQATRTRLATMNMTVIIHDSTGQVLYQSGPYDSFAPVVQEVMVTDGVRQLGTAYIYECTPTIQLTLQMLLVGLGVLLLTLAGIVYLIARTILHPLSAISQAAHQVAHSDLDFHFPAPRIQEVAEMFQSFTLMGEALHESLLRQAEVEQERRLFISAIAHDLRTPLFSLRGYLEGLATGLANTQEKVNRYVGVCQAKAASLERLIADLFAYTQLEYLETVPRREATEMGALITHVLESLEPQAQSKRVALRSEAPSVSCHLQVDVHLLTRVFENLLDNALRYTPADGTVHVRWYLEREHFVFTITDMGPGIADADLPHLFTPLYRGDSSRNQHTGGTGLGLAIAQRILRAHGGELTAANAISGGAVFTGSLARKVAAEEQYLVKSVEQGVV